MTVVINGPARVQAVVHDNLDGTYTVRAVFVLMFCVLCSFVRLLVVCFTFCMHSSRVRVCLAGLVRSHTERQVSDLHCHS